LQHFTPSSLKFNAFEPVFSKTTADLLAFKHNTIYPKDLKFFYDLKPINGDSCNGQTKKKTQGGKQKKKSTLESSPR